MRRLLDAYGGVVKTFDYDEAENLTIIHTLHDVDPILEWNKMRQNDGVSMSPSRDLQHLGRIPYGVIFQCLQKWGVSQATYAQWGRQERLAFYHRILRDPDYKWCRVATGNI